MIGFNSADALVQASAVSTPGSSKSCIFIMQETHCALSNVSHR